MEKEERDKSSAGVADETGDSVTVSERRSQREKKNKRAFSPVLEEDTKKKRKKLPRPFSYTSSSRPCDLLPNGEPFCCKLCKSPYVTNPYAKGVRKAKRSRHVPLPKKRLDSVGREILVCNACCQILDRQIRPKKPNKELTAEERNKYLEDAKTFAKSLAETLNEPKAEKLYCPVSVYKICGCLQKYIKGKDTDETALELRVTELLGLMKEATHLREQKVYTVPENLGTSKYSRRRLKYIGYGNGHKKSKEYEEFVLDKRRVLKEDMRLCERATQRILLYSNNFLHKKLKTEERPCRITRTKGKAALGKLHDIDSLHKQTCCIDGCVRLSLTHPNLLKSWRSRAVSGQMEARKVIAEMLTPAGGYRLNCYQFVSMVTGCALTTIGKVNNQLRETGGRQDPPEHGMKRLWTNGQRNRTDTVSSTYGSDSHTGEPPVVQTQSVTGPELTSHVLRPSQNQANSTSTDAFPALPQGEVIRIEELMKKKYELQQQQQIVQYQIQQTLGQHSGLPQNTGWITPQLIGQFPNTIGSSSSSFVPVGNISQTEFPQYIPSISNFTLGQTNPSQFQLSTSQNMLVSKLNVPVLGQLGSSDSQIPTVTNHFFYDSNQVTSVNSHANLGPGPFQPTKSLSVGSSNTLQPVIEVVNLGQAQTDGEESSLDASKTQPLIGRQIIADYDNSVSSDAQLPHVLNSSVPNLTQFSHLNQNHFIPNLSPTITNQFEHTTASSKTVLKHVLLGTENSPTFPTELIHQPLLLSPIDPILQQIQTDKQGLLSDVSFTSEDNNSAGTVNINDSGKDASNVMLAFVDQNGVTHQFTFPNSAVEMESQLFSVNNKPAAIAGDLNPSYQVSNHAEQQINVQEQFNDQSSEDLAAYLSGGVQVSRLNVGNLSVLKPGDHLGETSGTHEFDKQSVAQTSRQIRDENNKETSTVSTKETLDKFPVSLRLLSAVKENQTVQNSDLSSNVSKNLETVGLLPTAKKPDHDMTEPALSITHRVFPNVVDKSTNTCVEQINDQNSCELNTKETDSNRESINKVTSSCESDTNTHLIGREKSRNFAKQDRGSTEKIRALQKGFDKAFSRNSPGDYSSEGSIDNMSSKLECNQTVDKYQEGKKQDRNHRSKHSPKEGFQKLQSRNGKVFLHSNSQRTAFEKHVKETQDACTYSDVEKLQLPNNESRKEKTVAKCTSIMQAEEKGGSDSNSSQTKTLQVSEKVKNKLRKSLNIPILPKPTKPMQPDLKLPVELQPLDSSLFVIPQSSQNITSLKHMTKSKVQVQQPVRIVQVGTTNAAATPPVSSVAMSAIDQPVSQSVSQIHKPAFSNSLVDGQQIYFTDAANISEITLLASNQNVRDGHDRNLSGNDAVSISQANVLSDNEMNSLQTSTSIREEQEAFRASETGITPDIRNINIDGCTSTSTNIMTIGNLPPSFFLQNIHIVSPPVQNNAFTSSLDSPIKDHSLTVVKKTDGQSVLALPFSHSLKAPQGPTASPKSRKQRFPNKTKKSGSAARAHVPPVPVILSANEKCHPKMSETRDHSPVQLVELSSDVIQKGVQKELNLLQTHPDSHV